MHNNGTQSRQSSWSKSKSASSSAQSSMRDVTGASKPAELGSAQLKVLRASPLYSPQSAKPKASSSRAVNIQKSCPFETTFDDKERRFPMYNGDRRLQVATEFRNMDILSDTDDQRLSLEVESLYQALLPLPDDVQRKQDLVEKLERLLNQQWPGKDFTVHTFGSSENLLATRNSDYVCIETEWAGFGQQICELSRFMSQCGMQKVVCRAQAKVPVVTIYDPELRVSCDMNINNMLALRNTKLVKTYVQIDDRARKLIFAIKQWASNRALSEAVCNTLTSYTWTLLIINYLQTRKIAPVLPSLQDWPHEPLPPMNGIDVSFADDINKYDTLQTFSMQNTESVGSLLFGFFHHYSHIFNYNRDVASVRCGRVLSRKEKGYPSDNMFCVEEPFTTTRNLGNTADMGSFRGILQELQRAHRLIANGESLEVVFAKYDPSKTNSPGQNLQNRFVKRFPNPAKKNTWHNTGKQARSNHVSEDLPTPSTHGFYQPRFSGHDNNRSSVSLPSGTASHETALSSRDQLQWQYITMAEHNRLVLNSNPYLYPAQLMQYAEAYCKNDYRQQQPPAMQRAKSVPTQDPGFGPSRIDTHRRFSETFTSGLRSRSPSDNRQRLRSTNSQYLPQFTVSESELSRPTCGPIPNRDLAAALGLRQIEMISHNCPSAATINRENLLKYDADFNAPSHRDTSSSETGESQSSSIAMTLASSRSSPNSMASFSPPVIPTYAQVFAGAADPSYRASPPLLQLNEYSDDDGKTSSHFTTNSQGNSGRQPVKQSRSSQNVISCSGPAAAISYAAKASTPARSSHSRDQANRRAGL